MLAIQRPHHGWHSPRHSSTFFAGTDHSPFASVDVPAVGTHVDRWTYSLPQSMDHRGTPESPGLVATLISDADLEVCRYQVHH